MSKKAWIIFAAITVVILTGLVFLSRSNQVDVSSIDDSKIIAATAASGNIADHTYGTTNGKAMLIEYGDYQCPACGSAYPNLKELSEEYKDKMTFVFRNLPLTSIHPNARAGAAAAEAAGLQGKYWEMHDKLYENQNDWSNSGVDERTSIFEGYARAVGIKDIAKFKTDMSNKEVNDKINFDMSLAKKVGATSTPTLLLDGKKIDSTVWGDKAKFKAEIEEAIKE